MASSCAALITPYSDAATSLAMVDEVAGRATPMPRPDRARATRMIPSPDDGPSVANSTMDTSTAVAPATVAERSPVRTVM